MTPYPHIVSTGYTTLTIRGSLLVCKYTVEVQLLTLLNKPQKVVPQLTGPNADFENEVAPKTEALSSRGSLN